MTKPMQHSDTTTVILGFIGGVGTEAAQAVEEAGHYPHWLSMAIGLTTLAYLGLKVAFLVHNHFKSKGEDHE